MMGAFDIHKILTLQDIIYSQFSMLKEFFDPSLSGMDTVQSAADNLLNIIDSDLQNSFFFGNNTC